MRDGAVFRNVCRIGSCVTQRTRRYGTVKDYGKCPVAHVSVTRASRLADPRGSVGGGVAAGMISYELAKVRLVDDNLECLPDH